MNIHLRADLRALVIQWSRELADKQLAPEAVERVTAALRLETLARLRIPEKGGARMNSAERSMRSRFRQMGVPIDEE